MTVREGKHTENTCLACLKFLLSVWSKDGSRGSTLSCNQVVQNVARMGPHMRRLATRGAADAPMPRHPRRPRRPSCCTTKGRASELATAAVLARISVGLTSW
jgi:hypothetical protein